MARKPTKQKVIKKIREALDIHNEWAAYLLGEPTKAQEVDYRPLEEVVGSPEWHYEWISIYKRTIELLETNNAR